MPTLLKRRSPSPSEADPTTTRIAILEAAKDLLALGGFESVTAKAIGERVGIAAPSIYKHYASLDEVLIETLKRVSEVRMDQYEAVLSRHEDARRNIKALTIMMIETLVSDPSIVAIHQQILRPKAARFLQVVLSCWETRLYARLLAEMAKIDGDADPKLAYFLLLSFCQGTAAYLPIQDHLGRLTRAQRNATLLAERGLSAALPGVDWASVKVRPER